MSKILETEPAGYGPAFAIHGFMRYLGLKPGQLVAYAIIYSQTVENGSYSLGSAVLADWAGMTVRTSRTTVTSLLEKGLIREEGVHIPGVNSIGRVLVATDGPVIDAIEAWKSDHPEWKNAASSPEKTSGEKTSPEKSSSGAISSPENISSPEKTSPEKSSSGAISSPENISSPEESSPESPYIPIREDSRADWTDGWIENPSNQPSYPSPVNFQVDTDNGFQRLVDETVNRNRLAEAREAYDELLVEGIGAEEIHSAWSRFQAEARESGRADKYMPQLRKWLVDNGVKGCRRMVEAARPKQAAASRKLRRAPDGTWLVLGDGPVHQVTDGAGVAYRGDSMDGAIALARAQASGL